MQRERESIYEKRWKQDPEQFNPLRNCRERLRIKRTQALLLQQSSWQGKKVIDLGCGTGFFTEWLISLGAEVEALDIASTPFQSPTFKKIRTHQQPFPYTTLSDNSYDLIFCTELIAQLPPREHRLFFAELARLVKPDGLVLCSTPLDVNSEDPLPSLMRLIETEFTLENYILSHHKYQIKLKNLFDIPTNFFIAAKDKCYREEQLCSRKGISRWVYKINSSFFLASFWNFIGKILYPIRYLLKENESLLLFLEKICREISDEKGISHIIWIAKRKPLFEPVTEEEQPIERKHKKQVWE